MEALVKKICLEQNHEKQKQLIIRLMQESEFLHPRIQGILAEYNISPTELVPVNLPQSQADLDAVLHLHHDARRQAKIETIAEILQDRRVFSNHTSKKSLNTSPTRNQLSYKSILTNNPDVPLSIPLNPNNLSQRKISQQYKKLERLVKVSDNIKLIKIEEERKKLELAKELEEKSVKIKETQQAVEEERARKKHENDSKRQEKLIKKYNDLDASEIKALKENNTKAYKKKPANDRSRTTLNMRPFHKEDQTDYYLEQLKNNIETSIDKARKLRVRKFSPPSQLKLPKVKENRVLLIIEEEKKAQELLGSLNATVENSRQKRKEILTEAAEKINLKLNAKFEKFRYGSLQAEEKLTQREQKAEEKNKEREKTRIFMKEWYIQQGQLLSEINTLRKKDQALNLSKNQANLNEFKMKILFKHMNKDKTLKNLGNKKHELEKLRNNLQAKLNLKREKDTKDLNDSIAGLYKKAEAHISV